MKIRFTQLLLLVLTSVFFYTSCKKSETKPIVKPAADYSGMSKQIALNLVQALGGKYGGTNIDNGVKAVNLADWGPKGPVLNSVIPLCGFVIDTLYNNTTTAHDTTKKFTGNFKFIYTCSIDRPDGYRVHDSLVYSSTAPQYKNAFTLAQDYVVKALDTTYRRVSTEGSIFSEVNNLLYKQGFSVGYDFSRNEYKLRGLKIDITGGSADITEGTAEFISTNGYLHDGEIVPTQVISSGNILFLGNHRAKLSINFTGKSFMIDLLAGTVTVI